MISLSACSFNANPLIFKKSLKTHQLYNLESEFTFLNQSYRFEEINWNFSKYGKLWTYNLNYFDFLHQEHISLKQGLYLIKNFCTNIKDIKDGLEPYPISLRGINWIKFLSKNDIKNKDIDRSLYEQYNHLMRFIEYHLLGNHLLENGFSLLFGSYYFKDQKMYVKAKDILTEELEEQILKDGAHFELSPMYHQILLYRLLDAIQLVSLNKWKQSDLKDFLTLKAIKMLSWLKQITFENGDIPMVNDSTYNIAPSSTVLFDYATHLNISYNTKIPLDDSGYRMIRKSNYELFIDVGHIGPDYIPGHAHADTFSFILYKNSLPIIVDRGISTYEKNTLRTIQRSTKSHNTIDIQGINQSQIWGGFRVAKRAKIIYLRETKNTIKGRHNGYTSMGVIHERTFTYEKENIQIEDNLISSSNMTKGCAYIHFHPSVEQIDIENQTIYLTTITIQLKGGLDKIEKMKYDFSTGFNQTLQATSLKINFTKHLITTIIIQ